MKAGSFLLDTNAVVAYMREEPAFLGIFSKQHRYYVSATVLGELYHGAYNSQKIRENLEVVAGIKTHTMFLSCDADTAVFFGQLKAALRAIGRPIPENDVWIAATALQYKLPLITRDIHFDVVPELEVVGW